MKKLMMALLAMMAVLFGTTACGDSIFGQTRIKGSGNLITRTVAVGNFHTIDASRGVKVLLTDEPGDIEICADDNLIEYVRVGIDGGELKITVAPRIHAVPSEQILVRVPYNGNIRKLEASSAAEIVAKTLFTGRMLEIEASSAARIRVDAQVETCEIDASSSAKVVAQIDADRLEADASSASSILLQGAVQKAVFEASSAALIDARAGRTLLRGGGVERRRYSGLLRAGFAIPNVERRKRFLCRTVQCEFCRYERRFYSRCSE